MDRNERRQIIGAWLKRNREAAGWTRQETARLIREATPGWNLERNNYGQYELGKPDPTPEVLARFEAFWKAHGQAGPDFSPRPSQVPPVDPMERIAAALEDIARSLGTLRMDMSEQSGRTIGAIETMAAQLSASLDRRQGA
jgi:transcriptional regulator with XRE-family HTH domain